MAAPMNSPLFQYKNLEEILKAKGGAVKLLRNSPMSSYTFPVLPAEYSTWMDEQRAWKNESAFLDLSYHQTDLYIRGSDALKLFQKVAMTKFGTFPSLKGKQFIAASPDGYQIGDGICFHYEQDRYRLAGPPMISNWVQYNAEAGNFDVEIERDETVSMRPGDPKIFIFQIQGPRALDLVKEVSGGTLPDIGFFAIGDFTIAGKPVKALRHGMAGEPGFEIFGPWGDQETIRAAFDKAGPAYGMKKIGGLSYGTTAFESGWQPLPLPAIYHSEEMRPYREWLKPKNLEVLGSLGGSFYSDNIADYYMDPVEIGYGRLIDVNRDFIGREALEQKIANQKRKKVTLVWNSDDIATVMKSSLFDGAGKNAKFMRMPLLPYSTFHVDQVLKGGSPSGISSWGGYSANAGAVISLSLVDIENAEIGTELTVLWGEPNSTRPTVEKHQLREIRAVVAPAPFFQKTIKDDSKASISALA